MLDEQGYIIFKELLTPHEVEQLKDCIDDDQVHYTFMQTFIENAMLRKTSHMMGPDWDLKYVKYRVSDNNNSDAGGFHRDIIDGINIPVFTCLTYLDSTTMELIPGSHRIVVHPLDLLRIIEIYGRRIRITMNPGDVLLFSSNLIHRGIFTEKLPHRRLIQVFEVFKNKNELELYADRFIHVRGKENMSDGFDIINRTSLSIYFVNIASYINAITGYGNSSKNRHKTMDKMALPSIITCFSSEGFRERLTVVPHTWQPINKYIINHETKDLSMEYYNMFKWDLYNRQYFIMFMLVIVCITLLMQL